jgi:Arc/MetJ family transcription regulator
MARTRTNIEIDDDLVATVMRQYALTTKTEAVHLALRKAALVPMTVEEALAMEGAHYIDDVETESSPHW